MVGEVKLSITRSWVQNLSLPDERSNRETSRRIGFYSVYLVSLQGQPFIQLHFIYIDFHRHLFIHYSQERLSDLALLSIENERALNLDFRKVTQQFASAKATPKVFMRLRDWLGCPNRQIFFFDW